MIPETPGRSGKVIWKRRKAVKTVLMTRSLLRAARAQCHRGPRRETVLLWGEGAGVLTPSPSSHTAEHCSWVLTPVHWGPVHTEHTSATGDYPQRETVGCCHVRELNTGDHRMGAGGDGWGTHSVCTGAKTTQWEHAHIPTLPFPESLRELSGLPEPRVPHL